MNSLTKTLSALAISGLLAGTAFAGPNAAYAGFTPPVDTKKSVGIALFRSDLTPASTSNCPMIKERVSLVPAGNPKNVGVNKIVTGYSYDGCVGASVSTMSCKGSKTSCADMLQAN